MEGMEKRQAELHDIVRKLFAITAPAEPPAEHYYIGDKQSESDEVIDAAHTASVSVSGSGLGDSAKPVPMTSMGVGPKLPAAVYTFFEPPAVIAAAIDMPEEVTDSIEEIEEPMNDIPQAKPAKIEEQTVNDIPQAKPQEVEEQPVNDIPQAKPQDIEELVNDIPQAMRGAWADAVDGESEAEHEVEAINGSTAKTELEEIIPPVCGDLERGDYRGTDGLATLRAQLVGSCCGDCLTACTGRRGMKMRRKARNLQFRKFTIEESEDGPCYRLIYEDGGKTLQVAYPFSDVMPEDWIDALNLNEGNLE